MYGTWQRRGYTSMNGCVAAISVYTGKVLDIEVMSSYCPTCKRLQIMPRNFEYESSKANHICQYNFTGSSSKREIVGASPIFLRSEKNRRLQYTQYYGYGDSKAFVSVKDTYGLNSVTKFECIGHVQKRVGSRLRKLKTKTKGLSGRPRVTTPNEDRYLAVTAKKNRRSTESDLSRQLSSATGTTVSKQIVYICLRHIGLYARRPVRCVPLTATHCRLRLTWSRKHALWTPQQWSCVMFSDEPRFSLQSDSRRTLIWRAPATRYHEENTIERHVMVVQDGSFREELFLVPELTCMFRV
ncbi:HTH_Tnp_Tc3_2 domain-containing protein [Trichonephila clavipes]|nr:HTH_Tnp_Tc3_2 domain-containing protein [Trichonephila clavipes]